MFCRSEPWSTNIKRERRSLGSCWCSEKTAQEGRDEGVCCGCCQKGRGGTVVTMHLSAAQAAPGYPALSCPSPCEWGQWFTLRASCQK